jgi:hypothetical protein
MSSKSWDQKLARPEGAGPIDKRMLEAELVVHFEGGAQ